MLIDAVVFGALGLFIGWLIRTYLLSSTGGLGTGGAIGLCIVVWIVVVLVLATWLQGQRDYLMENLLKKAIAQQHQRDPSWVPLEQPSPRYKSSSPMAGNAASALCFGLFIGVRRRKQLDDENEEHLNKTQSYECPNCRKQGSIRKKQISKCSTSEKPDWIFRCPDCNYIFDARRHRKQDGDENEDHLAAAQRTASVESIPYECPNCNRQGSIRKERINKCGTTEKPDWNFRCPGCKFVFDVRNVIPSLFQ